jgi:hypothetical protein
MTNEGIHSAHILWVVPDLLGCRSSRVGGNPELECFLPELTAREDVRVDLLTFLQSSERSHFDELEQYACQVLGAHSLYAFPIRGVRNANLLHHFLRTLPLSAHPTLPSEMWPYAGRRISDAFEALFQGKIRPLKSLNVLGDFSEFHPHWGAVVYDGLHGAAHMLKRERITPSSHHPPLFYRAHGIEGDRSRAVARESSGGIRQRILATQAQLVKSYELALLRKVVEAFPITPHDAERFQQILPRLHKTVLPYSYRFSQEPHERTPEDATFLLPLNFESLAVQSSVRSFLRDVWPEFQERRPHARLVVASESKRSRRIASSLIRGVKGVESLSLKVLEERELYGTFLAALFPCVEEEHIQYDLLRVVERGVPVITSAGVGLRAGLDDSVSVLEAGTVKEWLTQMERAGAELTYFASTARNTLLSRSDVEKNVSTFLQRLGVGGDVSE